MKNLYGYAIDPFKLPTHVAIIMDGNGRWAKRKGLERVKGHEQGYQSLKNIIDFNVQIGVPYISVYAFSTENWSRPKAEVDFLMHLAQQLVIEYTDTLIRNNVRLAITGTDERLNPELLDTLRNAVHKTSRCTAYTFNIAFNYGSKREILDAVIKIANDLTHSKIAPQEITEKSFHNYLYHPEIPEVDLLIRTSGEKRLSNFFLWQCAYAEFYFTQKLWPDFKPRDFCKAIYDYQQRKRRFGGIE